jgi:hypothetical protein
MAKTTLPSDVAEINVSQSSGSARPMARICQFELPLGGRRGDGNLVAILGFDH